MGGKVGSVNQGGSLKGFFCATGLESVRVQPGERIDGPIPSSPHRRLCSGEGEVQSHSDPGFTKGETPTT